MLVATLITVSEEVDIRTACSRQRNGHDQVEVELFANWQTLINDVTCHVMATTLFVSCPNPSKVFASGCYFLPLTSTTSDVHHAPGVRLRDWHLTRQRSWETREHHVAGPVAVANV